MPNPKPNLPPAAQGTVAAARANRNAIRIVEQSEALAGELRRSSVVLLEIASKWGGLVEATQPGPDRNALAEDLEAGIATAQSDAAKYTAEQRAWALTQLTEILGG
jgi:hypothetical protein